MNSKRLRSNNPAHQPQHTMPQKIPHQAKATRPKLLDLLHRTSNLSGVALHFRRVAFLRDGQKNSGNTTGNNTLMEPFDDPIMWTPIHPLGMRFGSS